MFRETVPAATVKIGHQLFGQVINKVGKIEKFGHKYGFWEAGPHIPSQFFWEYPPPRDNVTVRKGDMYFDDQKSFAERINDKSACSQPIAMK